MTAKNRVLTAKRGQGGGPEFGFTLIEILIVIVVLGVLAAIVVFALVGVTGETVVAACSSDSRTVDVAARILTTENPESIPTTSSTWKSGLLPGSVLVGAPYLQSWPAGTSYTVTIAGAAAAPTTGNSPAITPSNGDVIVTVNLSGKTYDFTKDPTAACTAA